MNSVNLIGRLTDTPAIYEAKDKNKVANFFLAVARIGSDEADFIRCVAFGKTADFIEEYFDKGSRVGITGRIQTGRYENKDGETVYTTDVIVERCDFADGPKRDNGSGRSGRSGRSDRSRR